jgi:hypothetical protein
MGSNVKKRDWFYFKVYKHAQNQKTFASHNQETIDAQSAHGVVGEKTWKVVQFSIVLHLL